MMSSDTSTTKEKCLGCEKFIWAHNKIMSCSSCKVIVHAKCSKSLFEFNQAKNSWLCWQCILKPPKYNPFSGLTHDKHDPNSLENIDDIHEISNILENCTYYDTKSFNKLAKQFRAKNDRMFSCMFNNIDGCTANFDTFAADIVGQHKNLFSVIGIAETNIDPCHKNLFNLNDYTSDFNDKFPGKKKGSGIGLYVHNDYIFDRIDELTNCTRNLETHFITITNTTAPITVGVVYRPHTGSVKDFLIEWENILANLPNTKIHLMGDLNINLLKDTKDSQELQTSFYSKNLIPTISEATHEKPGCESSLIDNILINCSENLISSGILERKVSHHAPVFCFMNHFLPPEKNEQVKCPKYDYCESKVEEFLKKIDDTVFLKNCIYDTENFLKFIDTLKNEIELCFKVDEQEFKKSKRNFYVNPWITPGIIASITKKHLYYKLWKKTQTKDNLEGDNAFYHRFKSYRKYLKKVIKHAKKNFYCKKFNNVHGDLKKTWALINELRGNVKQNIKASFVINGQLVVDRREISNEFNKFFASVAKKLNTKTCSSTLNGYQQNTDYMCYLNNKVQKSIFLSPTSPKELEEIVYNLENDKSSDISITILKKCFKLISANVSGFFNKFMITGEFPDILKIGKITPIFKKGNPQLLDNYRPVSIIPIFAKIFEKVIYSRLYSFLTAMNVIYDKQFGFRKNHSTTHAINYSIDKILGEIEAKNHVIGIFVDLSKAFDTIDHQKLLTKLEHYGIRGICHDLLKSYLSNRKQYTNFQQTLSDECSVEYGVPQGSVLGPLLFLIYINDIVNCSELGTFVLFADDTNIFVSGKNKAEAYMNANLVLDNMFKYMVNNQLHINMSKSVHIHFKPSLNFSDRLTCARVREHGSEQVLKIGNQKLKKVDKVKFLGVVIDEDLKWEPHIQHLTQKLNSALVMIKRIIKFIPKSEYMKIYDALFKSHLSYCISSWGAVPSAKLQGIFSIQKRCIRLLFGTEYSYDHSGYYETCARARTYEEHISKKNFCLEHTKPLFNSHNLLSVFNLYTYHTILDVYKILKTHTPISLFCLFKLSKRDRNFVLQLPSVKLDISMKNFVYNSSIKWNSLINKIFEKIPLNENNVVVGGSVTNSDFCASIPFIKKKLKTTLLESQALGDSLIWVRENAP